MHTLNINKLIDSRVSCLERFYFQNKEKNYLEIDISEILNQKMQDIRTTQIKDNKFVDPNEEVIFSLFLDAILAKSNVWFFNSTESIYQITSFGFLQNPKIPRAILTKSDKIKVEIDCPDKKINIRYKLMMESFKSNIIEGTSDILSKAYVIEKLPISYVFKNIKAKITIQIDESERLIFEKHNFNIEELEDVILSKKEEYKESLKIYFSNIYDYEKNYSSYLKTLTLSSLNFKTDDVYRMFLRKISQKTPIDQSQLIEFQKLDKKVLETFTSHFET